MTPAKPELPVIPIAPTEERWRAMTPAERERFLVSVNEVLSDPVFAMAEGRPHKKAKSRAIDMLSRHFRAMGKHIYLAEELSVIYPGAAGFVPDVMARCSTSRSPRTTSGWRGSSWTRARGSTGCSRCFGLGTAKKIWSTT